MRPFHLLLLMAAVPLVACASSGSGVPAARIYGLSQEQQTKVRSIRIYDEGRLGNIEYEVIGAVEGFSCGRHAWVLGQNVACVERLKYRAWELGANGITNVRYSIGETSSGCDQLVKASADAIKVADDRSDSDGA